MSQIYTGTTYVLKDEPCFMLRELNRQSPDNKGFRRYQEIFVIRDGRIAQFTKDMGKERKYKGVDQFQVPGGLRAPDGSLNIVHKVGELLDIADQLRFQKSIFDKRELKQVNKIHE